MTRKENENSPSDIQYLGLLLMDSLNHWNIRLGLTQFSVNENYDYVCLLGKRSLVKSGFSRHVMS